jgi:hypothetical protein
MQLRRLLFFTALIFTLNLTESADAESAGKIPVSPGGFFSNLNLAFGFRGGVNFSLPVVINPNEVIQGDDPSAIYEKDYSPFYNNIGYHYAFMFMAYLNESLSLSVEPAFATYSYKYESSTEWTNSADPTDYIDYMAKHKNSVSYLELPVVLRYEFSGNKIQTFISLGLSYGYMIFAAKRMNYTVTRHTGALSLPYENSTQIINNAGSYIHSRFGVAPGIGFFYPLGTVKLMLSADFSFPLNNIVNESQRFANSSVTTGMYDVQDDLRLGALNITLGVLFNASNFQGGSSRKKRGGKAVECPDFSPKKK